MRAANAICERLENDHNRQVVRRLLNEINEIGTYNSVRRFVLLFLKIVYYPLSLFLSSFWRNRKVDAIRSAVVHSSRVRLLVGRN